MSIPSLKGRTFRDVPATLHRMLQRRAAALLARNGFTTTETRYSVDYLRRYGFKIRTFVDVGVFEGSPVFYELFRDSKLVLIDPLSRARRVRDDLARTGADVDFIEVAAGSTPGTAVLKDSGPSSSLLKRRDGVTASGSVTVAVDTLDNRLLDYDGPIGLKIDTEGFDLEVVRGATETLKRTEFVFSEVSIRRRFDGSYSFSEFIAEMARHGFEVAELVPHPGHNRLSDILFVRAESQYLAPDAVRVRKPGQRFGG